jgi:Xaa-Pro aminopeptidase
MPDFHHDELASLHADAMLVSFLPNVRYLTGYTGSNGLLLLTASGEATFFTDPRYRIQAAAEVNCRVKVSSGPILTDVVALVAKNKIRRLGFEKSRIGFETYEFLKSKLLARAAGGLGRRAPDGEIRTGNRAHPALGRR